MRIVLDIEDRLAAGIKGRLADYNRQAVNPVDEAGLLLAIVIPLEQWAKDYPDSPVSASQFDPIPIEQTPGE